MENWISLGSFSLDDEGGVDDVDTGEVAALLQDGINDESSHIHKAFERLCLATCERILEGVDRDLLL